MVGCLLYVANVTRPDLAYAATALARFMGCPSKELIVQARGALRYLLGTRKHQLVFGVARAANAAAGVVYSDADWANCTLTRRSISGHVVMVHGTAVLWGSKKQPVVTKSTCAAEYIAASMAVDEALMAIKLFNDF
jgi:hypothetical protein